MISTYMQYLDKCKVYTMICLNCLCDIDENNRYWERHVPCEWSDEEHGHVGTCKTCKSKIVLQGADET